MSKEIVINSEKEQTQIAIVDKGELVELFIENPEHARTLGDICLGRVRRIMPSIQAAFVDIGQKQDAFLHFSDLAENLPEMLEFVEQESPKVGIIKQRAVEEKTIARRRRLKRPQARQAVAAGEEEPDEDRPSHRTDSRERGKRRAIQRKPRTKPADDAVPKRTRRRTHLDNAEQYLKRDQRILVKVVKEPISNKGSRVSTDISLAGRFLVLVPLADYVAVSKKIQSYKERRRLRALARMLVPDGFGVIVRTVAEGRNAKALDTDLRLLLEKWRNIEQKLAGKPKPPKSVHEDVNMVSSIIRDLFSDDYDRIQIDDPRLYRNIKSYVQAIAPQMVPAVQLHKGKQPIFEAAGIMRQVEQAFSHRVDLPSGGYLFIERTEAMHVVDVNSGRSGKGLSQEENSLRVNLESARALARQVRLRDLGGIIVVDFIDLRNERNKKKVLEELKKEFRKDRAVTKVLPMSDFGLMQITRQRLRPSITTTFAGPNGKSSENGSPDEVDVQQEPEPEAVKEPTPVVVKKPTVESEPSVKPLEKVEQPPSPPQTFSFSSVGTLLRDVDADPAIVTDQLESWLADFKTLGRRGPVNLLVHPLTAAYLLRGLPTLPTRWFMRYLVRVRIVPDKTVSPFAYLCIDPRNGNDITASVRNACRDQEKSREDEEKERASA
jgi:ribonuclease G